MSVIWRCCCLNLDKISNQHALLQVRCWLVTVTSSQTNQVSCSGCSHMQMYLFLWRRKSHNIQTSVFLELDLINALFIRDIKLWNLQNVSLVQRPLMFFFFPCYSVCPPTIFDGVFDGSESISHGVFDLCQGVFVGSLHQQGHRARVTTLLNKRVFLLSLLQKAKWTTMK